MRDRDHQRDRRDDQDQRRNHQAGDAEEGEDGLTLARHQVDAAQRLRNPDHACQADQDQRKRRQRRAENIPVDRPHRYRTIPPCAPERAACDQSRDRDPHGRAAIRPAGSLSHYHPFDPSTKWLRHGTLRIWLIIHLMWPCGHGGAWQRGALTGHSGRTNGLDGLRHRGREHSEHPGPAPGPATALILEDLPMSDAVKVGFVPFSAAPRGILVVFCDDTLKFGAGDPQGAGDGGRYWSSGRRPPTSSRAKAASTLDILAPEGLKAAAPDRGRRRQAVRAEGERFSQIRRRGRRQAQRRQRRRHHHRGTA